MARARSLSRYVSHSLDADPSLEAELAGTLGVPFGRAEMASFLAQRSGSDEGGLKAALRELRRRVMLRVVARDLGGMAGLPEVVRTVTDLAEVAVDFASERIAAALREVHGRPVGAESGEPQELLVVGMGKLGGQELNVSSDIDLIFVYPEEGETEGPRAISNHEFFTRLGRRLIAALAEATAEGFVFRVDMRLRPYGESGPLVSSFAALEEYFYTQGREWERYAWIKGRVISGSRARELEELVRPFVFRKYLDYGAYESLRSLHAQIRQEVGRREIHDNIKLGPGGIREIEFVTQVFQLIRGGRDAALRERATLRMLATLGERRLLPPEAASELTRAYVFLRNLEHRLQYLDDRQTQTLPRDEAEQTLVARAMGFDDYDGLLRTLEAHRQRVTVHFEHVFTGPQDSASHEDASSLWCDDLDEESAAHRLAGMGFGNAPDLAHRLRDLRQGSRYRQLSEASQRRVDSLVPAMLRAALATGAPDQAARHLIALVESVGRRASYLSLLQEYPSALDRVARMAAASSWAAGYLAQHPVLLDELLDSRELFTTPDWARARQELEALLGDAEDDAERQMDILRHFHHAKVFRLAAMDLEGLLKLETLSDHLSWLADLVLGEVLRLVWRGLRKRHREQPRFAIAGYGKLGGKELGYATDLDIIFLYDDPHPDAPEIYARLGQRIITWLTTYTGAGILYETDLRLRPDGASGLLVSPIASFTDYQLNHAWVWEHQALTRARYVAGDTGVGQAFEDLRIRVLRQERDLATLREEVTAMRAKMREAHPNDSGLFDIKHDRGGIVDVEFIVQYLVLGHSSRHEGLTGNIGNIALLGLAGEIGLIPPELAERARHAYREFRRTQHQIRLNESGEARVDPAGIAAQAAAVRELWETVFGAPPP